MSEEFIIDVKNLTKFFIKDGVKVGIFLAILRSVIPAFYRNKLFAKKNKCYALRNVNFKAATGEAIGVVGVNGSGKSTLMQIIAGTMQPSDGRVNVTGRISAILELGSAFSPDFTGIENVRLNLTLLGIKSSDLEYKMKEAIEYKDSTLFYRATRERLRLEIGTFYKHPNPSSLSSNELTTLLKKGSNEDSLISQIQDILHISDSHEFAQTEEGSQSLDALFKKINALLKKIR